MKSRGAAWLVVGALAAAGAAAWWGRLHARNASAPGRTEEVRRAPFAVWTPYDGLIESRRTELVFSRFRGSATLVELAPEGQAVRRGDRLVRFDGSQVESDILKLDNRVARAQATLNALANSEIPLELREGEAQLAEARYQLESERRFLADSRELQTRNLVSRQEIDQQEMKVKTLEARAAQIEERRRLVEQYAHPARLAQARSDLAAEQQQLDLARQQLASCEITAPASGVAVYQPIHVGGEYRTVRVGDTVYQNQPFMVIPDMTDLVVNCEVPESDLARVQPGAEAAVKPLACPDLTIKGRVESVGAIARTPAGYPAWQKYFRVAFRIEEQNERLRAGMSARVEVLSHFRADALLLPRLAVDWETGSPRCQVASPQGAQWRPLRLGPGNVTHFEVLDGLRVGERVILP